MQQTAQMHTALITGAAGFLGRTLAALLQGSGVRVRAVDRIGADGPWDEFLTADLTRPGSFAGLCDGVDTVFHLAAKTHAAGSSAADLEDYRRLNVELTRHLLQAASDAPVARFLFTSSVKVLGEGGTFAQSEEAPPRPESAYGETKRAAEDLVRAWGEPDGRAATVLRMPLIYGPGVKGNLETMLRAVDRGRFPPLPDTRNRRSLVDVRDVARALVLCAESPGAAGRTYLVTDGRAYSTFEMAALMRAALQRPQPRWTIPAACFTCAAAVGDALGRLGLPVPYDGATHHKLLGSACYDSSAIERELGFRPEWDLERALPAMCEALSLSRSEA